MGAREEDLNKFAGFTGLNNKSKETALTPNALRQAVDVDLDRDSKLSSRRGYSAPIVPATLGHSLWSSDFLSFGLYADGEKLMAFEDGRAIELRGGLSPGMPISYALINDAVFWSNGIQRGQVTLAMDVRDWACDNPDGQPELEAIPGGTLTGDLQVCVTFTDAYGRESGATLAAAITVPPQSRLRVHHIPQPSDISAGGMLNVYVTDANGMTLLRAASIPSGMTEYTVVGPPAGRALATQFLHPMPAGHIVRLFNGRQLVARGNMLLWSNPLRYGMFHPGHNAMRMPHKIDLMEPIGEGEPGAGVYIASGPRTFFLSGPSPADWSPRVVNTYGAVPGSSCPTPADAWGIESQQPIPAWLAQSGLHTVGLAGGQLLSYNREQLVLGVGDSAASLFRESDGLSQFLTTVRGATIPRAGIADTAIARVYHHDGGPC